MGKKLKSDFRGHKRACVRARVRAAEQAACPKVRSGKILLKVQTPAVTAAPSELHTITHTETFFIKSLSFATSFPYVSCIKQRQSVLVHSTTTCVGGSLLPSPLAQFTSAAVYRNKPPTFSIK